VCFKHRQHVPALRLGARLRQEWRGAPALFLLAVRVTKAQIVAAPLDSERHMTHLAKSDRVVAEHISRHDGASP